MLIQPGLTYLTRVEWGADTSLPRLGVSVPKRERTEAIIHHTVIVDSDATKNRWTNLAEVKLKMCQLQVIRPDLGKDVPYNFVMFLMEDGTIIVCEGRGLYRSGAHTRSHNYKGMATALQGNFMLAVNLNPYVAGMSRWWGWLKHDRGLTNLGSVHPVGKLIYGHRDFRDPNDASTWTSCPGDKLYTIIPQLVFKENEDMTDAEFLKQLNRVLSQGQVVATLADGKTKKSKPHALGWWIDKLRRHDEDKARHAAGGVSRAQAKADALAIAKAEDIKLKVRK